MKVKELMKELKKYHGDAEIDLINCHNENCPCAKEGGECDSKGCGFTAFDISHVYSVEKSKDEKHDRMILAIEIVCGWNYDKNGNEILEN